MASSDSISCVGRAQSVANKRNIKGRKVKVCKWGLSERRVLRFVQKMQTVVPRETVTAHTKHSGMHARDLLTVMFRHHLARNAVWIRGNFKLTLELNCHCMSLLMVWQQRKVPLNVRTYSVVMFMVYCATLPAFNLLSCRQTINIARIINANKILSLVILCSYSMLKSQTQGHISHFKTCVSLQTSMPATRNTSSELFFINVPIL